jgi:NADH-quinone oxidoreductase subunit A
MAQFLPVLTLLVLAVVFAALSSLVSKLLAPRRPTAAKSAPYECGIVPQREPPDRFPVRFYLVAMIFIVFDIEVIFLYPWAVIYRELGPFGLWEIVGFAVVVFAAFVYLIANGALDWGPVKRVRQVVDAGMVSASRTSTSTIRRVGLDGRGDVARQPQPAAPAADLPAREEVPA